jgi:23S rRNA (adenine2503-C2)-methyltransferase
MGEPLANYDNVMQAVRRIQSELGIGARHITISTVGLVPRIINLADENMQVKAMIY